MRKVLRSKGGSDFMYNHYENRVVTLNLILVYSLLICESGIRCCVLLHTTLQAGSAEIFHRRCSLPGQA
jgi:hypothetical protein